MKMAMRTVMLVAVLALTVGCGKGTDADIRLKGDTTFARYRNTIDKEGNIVDTRYAKTFCPGCGKAIDVGTKVCTDKNNCGIQIVWPQEISCRYCTGTGVCSACKWLEQNDEADCLNCGGEGVIAYKGETAICSNCQDNKKCPICTGSRQCDMCGGGGNLSIEKLAELVERAKEDY